MLGTLGKAQRASKRARVGLQTYLGTGKEACATSSRRPRLPSSGTVKIHQPQNPEAASYSPGLFPHRVCLPDGWAGGRGVAM